MPRKERVVVQPVDAVPAVSVEIRLLVEDTEHSDGHSKLLAGRLEFAGPPSEEDVQNAVFDLVVEVVNAAAWDIGLGEIFEVEENDPTV